VTPFRAGFLIGAVALLALAVVTLRSEQARAAARTVALESRWIESRRELWKLQTGVARLRAPGRLHGSLEWFGAELATRDPQRSAPGGQGRMGPVPRD
jgi:hypothetical protein